MPDWRRILLCACLGPLSAFAGTLDPSHGLWQRSDLDRASFRRLQAELRAERPKALSIGSTTAEKGFARYGLRILVVPVVYADRALPSSPTRAQLAERCFGDAASSLRSYWEVASGGRFVPAGEVLDWVRVPERLSRYRNVENGAAVSNPLAGPRELVRDALRAVAVDVDLHRFDDDGADGVAGSGDDDGFIDLLLILHPDAGFENDLSSSGSAMLAHASFLSSIDPELEAGGVVGGSYLLASAQGPLGVWAHELGHLLGLDDLYDLSLGLPEDLGTPRGGLGLWSLMAHGTWGDGGERPSGLDAYSRRRLQWDDAQPRYGVATERLETAGRGNNQSLWLIPAGSWGREHFLLERRERNSDGIVDGALPGDGVLLYQVDPHVAIAPGGAASVRLLQADGRDDLGELANNGDFGDVFVNLVELDEASQPPLRSQRPDPSRISPRITIGNFIGSGQNVRVESSALSHLQLVQADFSGAVSRRTHLLPNETAEWTLRFEPLGSDPLVAELDLVELDPRLNCPNSFPIALLQSGSDWVPVEALTLSAAGIGSQLDAPEIELELRVDGAVQRLRFGVPVINFAGFPGDQFYLWQPEILAAASDTTRWALLGLENLPANTTSGWQLRTDAGAGYGDDAELTLTSSWLAIDPNSACEFWSDVRTESAQPGEAFDGGVLEWQSPGGNWAALLPQGSTTWIRAISEAPTRANIGLGGRATGWQSYRAALPETAAPLRLRLRFGSDASIHSGHWSIAGLGTRATSLSAQLAFERGPSSEPMLRALLAGDASGLSTHQLQPRWRSPISDHWQPAALPQRFLPGDTHFQFVLELPSLAVLTLGLFVEDANDPTAPALLLGSLGLRPTLAPLRLSLLANPARGEAVIELSRSGRAAVLQVYDLRGRLVRTLPFGESARRVHWNGLDAAGRAVASGRYFLILDSDPSQRVALVWFR